MARAEEFPCEGLRVGRLWLDQGFGIELHPSKGPSGEPALVRFFLSFEYQDQTGRRLPLVAHEHAQLIPVFGLLGAHVTRAAMTEAAEFQLHLDTREALFAGSLDEADYWEFEQPWPKGGRWG